MIYLLDTNIVSQLDKQRPDPDATHWFHAQKPEDLVLSAIVIQELRFGIDRLPEGNRRRQLDQWLELGVKQRFQGRILPVNETIADLSGRFLAAAKRSGHTADPSDALIAATAQIHSLKLATLNRKHFEHFGVDLVLF